MCRRNEHFWPESGYLGIKLYLTCYGYQTIKESISKNPVKIWDFFFGISTMKFLHIFALICSFFGLFQWFRAKVTWETHPTGFLSQKKGDLGLFRIFFPKN